MGLARLALLLLLGTTVIVGQQLAGRQARPPPPPPAGTSPLAATLMGVNAHTAATPGVIDQLRSAGFSWVRNDVSWQSMERTPGVYDFTSWEYTMSRIQANNMGIIAIVSSRNQLYDGGTDAHTVAGIRAMAKWVTALAGHFQRTPRVWWELVNEPNSNAFYKNATLYANLVAAIATAVHTGIPNATVVGPASENIGLDTGWLHNIFEAHVLQHFDVVTVHPYHPRKQEYRSDGPETAAPDLLQVMDRIAEYAPPWKSPMPLANGEWGYGAASVGGVVEQARLFVRQQLITTSMTGQPSIWYEACGPDEGEGRMGLMNCTGGGPPFSPLPAFNAAKVLHHVFRNDGAEPGSPVSPAKGFRFVRRLPIYQSSNMDTADDWLLLYHSDDGGVLLAAWTSSEFEHIIRIPGVEAGSCFSQVSMMGAVMPNLCHDSRGLHVNVSAAPKYLLKRVSADAREGGQGVSKNRPGSSSSSSSSLRPMAMKHDDSDDTAAVVAATTPTLFFDVTGAGGLGGDYEAQAVAFTLQGLANRRGLSLMMNTSRLDFDDPSSDTFWRNHLQKERGVIFQPAPQGGFCGLVKEFTSGQHKLLVGAVRYADFDYPAGDIHSLYVAVTAASVAGNLLPVSAGLARRYPCLADLDIKVDLSDLGWPQGAAGKILAFRWAQRHLLPNCSRTVLWNADMYRDADHGQDVGTVLSLDYAVEQRAFVMDLSVLYACGAPGSLMSCVNGQGKVTRVATPEQAALYAGTNVTTHAGGVVFCSFSCPNLSFWAALGRLRGTQAVPLPVHDSGLGKDTPLSKDKVVVLFETNEGDTPRILSCAFTGQWLSPARGSVPVGWAIDPMLAELFPELWNFYASSTTRNDSFVTGVDGSGYIYLSSLGRHAAAYEERSAHLVKKYMPAGLSLVDVGVASVRSNASTRAQIEAYDRRVNGSMSGFLNACGTAYGQPLNYKLDSGTPVINSVCAGPTNDTSNGHFLYYYRDHLNKTHPSRDLAQKMTWAADRYGAEPARNKSNAPLFLLVFGGLGLYGNHTSFFDFVSNVMQALDDRFVVVGAQEFVRLARVNYSLRDS